MEPAFEKLRWYPEFDRVPNTLRIQRDDAGSRARLFIVDA
jgi:hypothetical protein